MGLVMVCIGALICGFFNIILSALDRINSIEIKLMDQKLITANDYAVVGQLPPGLYQEYHKRQTERLGSAPRNYTIFSTFETLIKEKV